MFVVLLHYLQPLSAVERHLEDHRAFLNRQYALGHFLASGPQVPRIGGVILAQGLSRPQLDEVLAEDPFYRERLAQYQVIEFVPVKAAASLQSLIASPA